MHLNFDRVVSHPHIPEDWRKKAKTRTAAEIKGFVALALVLEQAETVHEEQQQEQAKREIRYSIVDCVDLLHLVGQVLVDQVFALSFRFKISF